MALSAAWTHGLIGVMPVDGYGVLGARLIGGIRVEQQKKSLGLRSFLLTRFSLDASRSIKA